MTDKNVPVDPLFWYRVFYRETIYPMIGIIHKIYEELYITLFERSTRKMFVTSYRGKTPPQHIAIIMDGNRRFAKKLGLKVTQGHVYGKDKVKDLARWCRELKIPIVTVYAFSTENFNRREEEIDTLMKQFQIAFREFADDPDVHKYGVRIRAMGNVSMLPEEVQESIRYAEEKTKNYNNFIFNVAVAYGGREEIIEGVKKIAGEVKDGKLSIEDIDEEVVSRSLYTSDLPDPDIIIRTSGEERISNFLLWQNAYSELYFTDTYFPELSKADLLKGMRVFLKRQRRFGK
ncbi:MAG: polyprenyl diphosphate synthase [Candidatus Thermoplasmatota archaeon]|nr:polyprenyl diphosphate synthase [Candidatus Thermoplasmatota archaeon]